MSLQAHIVRILMVSLTLAIIPAVGTQAEAARTVAKGTVGPLNIPAVTGRVFEKAGRTELTLGAAGVVNDPFYYQLPLSLGLGYHWSESWSAMVQAEYVVAFDRGPRVSPGNVPSPTVHRPAYSSWLELSWAPFYGKVALFSAAQMHLDMYVSAGGGVVADETGRVVPMGTVALGQRYVLARWCALKLEIRHRIAEQPRLDLDVSGGPEVFWSGSISWSVFLPSGG